MVLNYTLLSTLKVLVCNEEKIGVCCEESFELVNGNGRRQNAQLVAEEPGSLRGEPRFYVKVL